MSLKHKVHLLLASVGCQGALCETNESDKKTNSSLILLTATQKSLVLPEALINKLKEAAS